MTWRYSINYGPDGQEDWANLIAPDGSHVANIRTHHAISIVAGMEAATRLRKLEESNAALMAERTNLIETKRMQLSAADARIRELEAENARLREALTFYRDRWAYTPNKRYGGLEWRPSETLLDDCGNIARAALREAEE